ncbi:Clan CE, family C48, Ulp1-like cysteine peptidase [Trichomonas vaginalis G3]|uniref:Clan CE, family C48, Ulp1-like cysteine peptidase n=1 Tax=Trichomonas vaginalis (strain ATCC PRA-98 / G3) TaxID=412133 RepID=A2DKA4_TRIV3|nr:protease family [Trichomonas vaginalis G3]EAY19081.1 Clan CE, family C48, Ulp1-like cysteine peptidase [Trichomonas vaginalis G3]KAI5490381.1 protease family [Trichomonas vaginalis G3]|eukprot:XP_001580067.1 Clan CE, family C48, Ulp1-like cysteine peptidase [Trichomonas vaginalis G3]
MLVASFSDEDLERLRQKESVVDKVINFFCEQQRCKYKENSKLFYFMEPCISDLLYRYTVEDSREFMKTRNIKEQDLIFIFIYNNFHFSLLCCRPKAKKKCFIHFDSIKGANHKYALEFSLKFINIFDLKCDKKEAFVEMECPQQKNSKDCAIYSIAFTDAIASKYSFCSSTFEIINPEYIDGLRENLYRTIYQSRAKPKCEMPEIQSSHQIGQS